MNIQQLQASIEKHQEFHTRKHAENKSGKNSIVRLGRLMTLNGLIMDLVLQHNDMLLDEFHKATKEEHRNGINCTSNEKILGICVMCEQAEIVNEISVCASCGYPDF